MLIRKEMERLPIESYPLALTFLKQHVTINHIFVEAVLIGKAEGVVHVDNIQSPKTFHVRHHYSMSMIFGEHTNAEFNNAFRRYALNIDNCRKEDEWLQAFPPAWNEVLQNHLFIPLPSTENDSKVHQATEDNGTPQFAPCIQQHGRVNFHFDLSKFESRSKRCYPPEVTVVPINESLFHSLEGHILPKTFWKTAEGFLANGFGYCTIVNEEVAAHAFAADVFHNEAEIGIETVPTHRGHGYAELVATAMVEHCIKHQLTPVWACRLSNDASYRLAQKVGFVVTKVIPYYFMNSQL
jgi:hypothetical protein